MRRTSIAITLTMALALGAALQGQADEFAGPFPSWGNVKTGFGAVGDGKADDTSALQQGLNAVAAGKSAVLYLPAGTYRITQGLTGDHIIGGMIIGEDPERTVIKWDGPANGTMLLGHSGFSMIKIARLTWDGSGKALTAVDHAWINPPAGECGTYNTHEDEIFKDVGFGIRAGEHSEKGSGMDAETHVQRCKFIRCWNAGVSIETFNALDWWLTNCEFTDCRVGATNAADGEYGGGHFHIYHSLFRNSAEADIKIGHCSYFGIRFNTSIGSSAFLLAIRPMGVISRGMWAGTGSGGWAPKEKWGSTMTLQGNTILDTRQGASIRVFNHGPLFLLDNTIRTRPDIHTGPAVFMRVPIGRSDLISIGNTFTVEQPLDTDARVLSFDDKVVKAEAIPDPRFTLPATPSNARRAVFEVRPGASADDILKVIAIALQKTGPRPVLHFPAGDHVITQTLIIPANSDLQLIGDGGRTRLVWKGPDGQPMLHLAGPTKVTLRDLELTACAAGWGKGDAAMPALLVTNCDQPGARVYGESFSPSAGGYGLIAENVDNLAIELFAHMNYGSLLIGGPRTAAGENTTAHLAIIGGASSNREQTYAVKNRARMVVWDTWYEGAPPRFLKLEGNGRLTLSDGVYYCGQRKEEIPELEVGEFTGHFLCQGLAATGAARMQVQEAARDGDILFIGNFLWGGADKLINRSQGKRLGFLSNRGVIETEKGESDFDLYQDQGNSSPEFIREMLQDLRTIVPDWDPKPTGRSITDLGLYRVRIEFGRENGGILLRGSE